MNSLVRQIKAKVELYNGSTLLDTYTNNDRVISIDIDRVGEESKFYGFGICQRLNVKLIDTKRELNITTANSFKIYFNAVNAYPTFYVSEVRRDEKTNELSITAYDAINKLTEYQVSELGLTSYTIKEFAASTAIKLNSTLVVQPENNAAFNTFYPEGANFEPSENLREALNDVAEATQTIYFLSPYGLVFKQLDIAGAAAFTLDKEKYFELSSKTNRRLVAVCHTTELGDNVKAELPVAGTTQYIRDNAFWEMRKDIDTLVENALAAVGNLTINQFSCSWRGDLYLAIGDKIKLITKDNAEVYSYVLNDSIKYDGALEEKTQWEYAADDEEEANPSTLGEALNKTFAKVDKVNKQINLVVSSTDELNSKVSNLQMTTDTIGATVKSQEKIIQDNVNSLGQQITNVSKQVDSKISADQLSIEVKKQIESGVDKVNTSTGFTFNDEGLTISKDNKEMTTQITEDGMTVYRDNTAVLVANNKGVDATNLHATTYLWVGKNSRFEDYIDSRTGCFWVGN